MSLDRPTYLRIQDVRFHVLERIWALAVVLRQTRPTTRPDVVGLAVQALERTLSKEQALLYVMILRRRLVDRGARGGDHPGRQAMTVGTLPPIPPLEPALGIAAETLREGNLVDTSPSPVPDPDEESPNDVA